MIISILNQFNMIDNNLFFEQKRNPFYYKLIFFFPCFRYNSIYGADCE